MRRIFAILVFLPTAAFGVSVGPMPASEYADTETATNIPFAVSFEMMSRVDFSVSLDATPTNGVEVSVGRDADADGNLSPEEASYTFGYDCGRWFVRDAVRDTESSAEAESCGKISRSFVLKKRHLDESWDLVRVVRRGKGLACELTTVEGLRPGVSLILR